MKVELKEIISQLSDVLYLDNEHRVSAIVDDNGSIVGWTIVRVYEDGGIVSVSDKFENIKELLEVYV